MTFMLAPRVVGGDRRPAGDPPAAVGGRCLRRPLVRAPIARLAPHGSARPSRATRLAYLPRIVRTPRIFSVRRSRVLPLLSPVPRFLVRPSFRDRRATLVPFR